MIEFMNWSDIWLLIGDDDGDGIPDHLDNDDDGDGIADSEEGIKCILDQWFSAFGLRQGP